jgi:hypothetical protein
MLIKRLWWGLPVVIAACGSIDRKLPDAGSAAPDAALDAAPDSPRCVPSPVGLQARWRGEMNAKDETSAHDGVATFGQFTPAGRHGAAFLFDGIRSFVAADPQDVLWPTGSFSIEAWAKASAFTTEYATVVAKYGCGGADGCDGSDYELLIYSGGHPQFEYRVPGGQIQITIASLANVLDGAWHHLVGVRDNARGEQRLYLDGILAVSRPISGIDLAALSNADGKPDPVTLGAGRASGTDTMNSFLPGAVDDVAIYYSALDDAQVAALHAAPDGICP